MEQFDREDTSQFTNRQSQSGRVEQQPIAPAPKKKKSKAPWILGILLMLTLAAAGAIGWQWYVASQANSFYQKDIVSAEAKVSELRKQLDDSKKTESSKVVTETESTDSEAVVKAALAYAEAPLRPLGDQREAKVEYLKNGFAKVIVTSTTAETNSGGTSVAKIASALTMKESNDDWIVLSAAEGPVADMDELMKTYGIPREAF